MTTTDTYNLDESFLYPGDAIKWIDARDNYRDYLLTQVLASHGCVIRDVSLSDDTARVMIRKCQNGNRIGALYAEIGKIPGGRQLGKEDYMKAFHSRDIIVRYYLNEDGDYSRPVWHTILTKYYNGNEQIRIIVTTV